MPLIGTAGHVDHGKSTLIRRLTGRDPDRWDEEKRRGLTIDLGFAWTELPSGTEVSFVDVPGHERYLKNMLAGIEAIEVALFVVGADEGWMPQSEEHLAVLDLLDVRHGVIALTKTDLVDPDLVDLATLEISEYLLGTSLESAGIVPVSGKTGAGMETLVAHLDELVSGVESADVGRPRLWVDRSFTASGAGTVVTGSLLDGSISVDDPAVVYPRRLETRVRGVQSHERSLEEVAPGRRVALNLAGLDAEEVERGDMVGHRDHWELTDRFTASLHTARYVEDLDRRGAYQIHVGSAVMQVTIVAMEEGAAVLQLQRPLPLAVGDRYVVRDTGRRLVVAGGRVLDPEPGPTRRALRDSASIDPDVGREAVATTLLELRGIDSANRLARQTRGGEASGKAKGDVVMSEQALERLVRTATEIVDEEHRQHPLRVGIPMATLAERLGVDQEVADLIIETSSELERIGPDVSLQGRQIEISEDDEAAWSQARDSLAAGLVVPTVDELGLDRELLHLKIRTGDLVRISEDLVFLPHQVEELSEIIRGMAPEFTVADFRDAADLSRKYAVPILEWSDREGLTVRRGDTRTAR